MKNLLTIIPKMTDGTSFYRGVGPLSHLKEIATADGAPFQMGIYSSLDWSILAFQHGVFAQRPFTKEHLRAIEISKANGRRVWVDYDDNLLKVPRDNPTHETYEENKKNVATILAIADEVSVSTLALGAEFNEIRKRAKLKPCRYIPNAWNSHMVKEHPERAEARNPLVIWRGSATHDRDLLTYANELQAVSREFKQWTFSFIGKPFWMVMEMLNTPNVLQLPAVDTIEYFDVLGKTRPSVMVVPLHSSDFNYCKSNIAAIEAFYAGAVPIVPDWEEWKVPGALRYRTREEFRNVLSGALLGTYDLKSLAEEGWQWVRKQRNIESVNLQRLDILQNIFTRP